MINGDLFNELFEFIHERRQKHDDLEIIGVLEYAKYVLIYADVVASREDKDE